MYTLKIKGFKSKHEIETFINWYVESGEQDASTWFEMDDDSPQYAPVVNCVLTYPIEWVGNEATMILESL